MGEFGCGKLSSVATLRKKMKSVACRGGQAKTRKLGKRTAATVMLGEEVMVSTKNVFESVTKMNLEVFAITVIPRLPAKRRVST